MNGKTTPTWDELLEVGTYTSAEAAAIRGVSQTAAKQAARSRGKRWHRSTRKITNDDLRAAAVRGLHVEDVSQRFDITTFQVWRRVKPLPDVEVKVGRLRVVRGRGLTAVPPAPAAPAQPTAISASPAAVARYLARKELSA